MRRLLCAAASLMSAAAAFAADPSVTEQDFRRNLGLAAGVRSAYRDLECRSVPFDAFAAGMSAPDTHVDVDRSVDGREVTVTVRKRGAPACAAPYPPITEMPPFDLVDLAGKRVTPERLHGKPTLMSFFFSTCVPCILEVKPLNELAAAKPTLNFLAVTYDEAATAREFVKRFGLRLRVVPDARDFIDRVRVKNYPMIALFDAQGRLLGTRKGGARDEFEAAQVKSQLTLWMESLLRQADAAAAPK